MWPYKGTVKYGHIRQMVAEYTVPEMDGRPKAAPN